MTLPSSTYSIADWSTSNVAIDDGTEGLLLVADVSRGTPHVTAGSGRVRLRSSDGLPSRLRYVVPVDSIHTIEFQATLEALPRTVEDAGTHRFFVGCLNAQGGTTGLLLAQDGIAMAADPTADVVALSGTASLIPLAGVAVTVRLMVNGRGGTAALYVTTTSELSTTGHVLRRTVALPKTRGRLGDLVYIEAIGAAADGVDVSLYTMRVGNGLVASAKRPVAVVASNPTVGLGASLVLDARGSYVPGSPSADLTGVWAFRSRPAGSSARLEGRIDASIAGSSVAYTAVSEGAAGNGTQLIFVDPGLGPGNDALEIEVSGSAVTFTLEHTTAGISGRTTANDIASALTNPSDPAYSAEAAALVRAVVSGDGDAIIASGTLTLAGGLDSDLLLTHLHPDVPGLYELEFAATYDGLTSQPYVVVTTCMASEVAIGREPDVAFLWNYLPDHARTIEGGRALEHVWRGLLRLTATEWLRAAQVDYAKSLRDIPAVMQHKWVRLPLAYRPERVAFFASALDERQMYPYDDEDGDRFTTYLRHTSVDEAAVGAPVSLYLTAGPVTTTCRRDIPTKLSSSTATYAAASDLLTVAGAVASGVVAGDPVFIGSGFTGFRVRAVVSDTQIRLDRPVGATASGNGIVQVGGLLELVDDVVPIYLLVDQGDGSGHAIDDGAGAAETTLWFALSYGVFDVASYSVGDRLLLGGTLAEVEASVPADPTTLPAYASNADGHIVVTAGAPASPLSVEELFRSWQLLRYVGSTALSVGFPRGIAFTGLEGVLPGDVVYYLEDGIDGAYGYDVVRGVSGSTIALGTSYGPPTEGAAWEAVILRLQALPLPEGTLGVPRIALSPDASDYLVEGKHFEVADEAIALLGLSGDDGEFDDSDSLTFTSVSSDFSVLDEAPGGAGAWVLIGLDTAAGQPCFVAPIAAVADATTLTLASVDGDYTGQTYNFRVLPLPAAVLTRTDPAWWAEYVLADNSAVVEGNFGLAVGLQRSEYDSVFLSGEGTAQGYLAAVRALHYAAWSGPTVYNIELGANALLGLPFSEVAGTIARIDSSGAIGTTAVQVAGIDGVTRVYRFRTEAGLGKHPNTGAELAEGDEIPAYTMLTAGVDVLDYINSPDWHTYWLDGADVLRKFHTFLVSIDLRAVDLTAAAPSLLRRFLDRAKPKHTDYILAGTYEVPSEEIDITDTFSADATLGQTDGLYTTPDGVIMEGVVASPSTTAVTLGAEAPAVADLYVGLTLRTVYGGRVQYTAITAYTSGRVATVSSWPLGTPTAASAYAVINPPPFASGLPSGLDGYDGRGNWGMDSASLHIPNGGEGPTAVVVLSGVSGVFQTGEEVRLSSNARLGLVKEYVSPRLYLDITDGSAPMAADALSGMVSGATATVTSATICAWPDYSYVSRHRSALWIPLEYNSIRGPVAATPLVVAYTASGGSGGPELEVDAYEAADVYVNYRVSYGSSTVRVVAHDGTTLFLSGTIGVAPGNTVSLHLPKPRARLAGLDFFEPGSWITGGTSGHRAQVYYFGPSYLLLRNADRNPYTAFIRGETLSDGEGNSAVAVNDAFFVFPDVVSALDRNCSLEVHCERRLCFYAGADGVDPALDMGLILDDVEVFQRPYDHVAPDEEQYVPSHGPGLYWWIDNKLVYNAVDEEPAGPDAGEPPWVASPEVPVGTVSTDPGWSDMVLHDTGICRVVSEDGGPALGDVVPDPLISSIL